jgi:hypothetical protein
MDGDAANKRRFNKIFSSARIWVEMTFGRLKARFPSLYCMGVVHNIQDLYRSIEALMVLHNICIDFGDRVDGQYGIDAPAQDEDAFNDARFAGHQLDLEEEREAEDDIDGLLEQGRAIRDRYLNMLG